MKLSIQRSMRILKEKKKTEKEKLKKYYSPKIIFIFIYIKYECMVLMLDGKFKTFIYGVEATEFCFVQLALSRTTCKRRWRLNITMGS